MRAAIGRRETVAAMLALGSACRRTAVEHPELPDEQGVASWYGVPFHGRKTASGEVFDMNRRTAAHRTLPFRTRLRVRDVTTGRIAEVVVTDRGPFAKGRIIDLSRAAGQDLDLMQRGTTEVQLFVLERPRTRGQYWYAVQVAMLADRQEAEKARVEMEKRFGAARLVAYESDTVLWRLLVGREESPEAAAALLERMGRGDDALVVMLDEE